METFSLKPIGYIRSELKTRDEAPVFYTEGAPDAVLGKLRIGPMEAIDGTPVVDIKPAVGSQDH